MTKINLLRAPKGKKRIGVRKEMIVFILSMVAALALLLAAHWYITGEKDKTVAQINNR